MRSFLLRLVPGWCRELLLFRHPGLYSSYQRNLFKFIKYSILIHSIISSCLTRNSVHIDAIHEGFRPPILDCPEFPSQNGFCAEPSFGPSLPLFLPTLAADITFKFYLAAGMPAAMSSIGAFTEPVFEVHGTRIVTIASDAVA